MKVMIEMKKFVVCKCECGMEGRVADLCAALHWAFTEALRHGPGCHLDIAVDLTFQVTTVAPSGLTISG